MASRKGFLDTTPDDWRRVIDLNLSSVFELAQVAARRMVEAGGGSIVLLASMMSFQGGFNVSAYAASKGASHSSRRRSRTSSPDAASV